MTWHTPTTVDEVLRLRAEQPDAPIVAGGTFLGILVRQGLVEADDWISLQKVGELTRLGHAGDLSVGAMVTHRRLELDDQVRGIWPGVAAAFQAVASPRIRNVATMGGVLADADYASDPPSMLVASEAVAEVASLRGTRRIPVSELIVGHYATTLEEDELITRVVVPRPAGKAVYRKLRTRSQEDRPASSVAAVVRRDRVRVVVGAVSDRPHYFPDVCETWQPGSQQNAREIGTEYAARIDYIDDNRGSAAYRRRVVAVEVARALMAVAS
ncbi:FAD binding domain-containing protein [Nocardioides kongjuensis]|uniref:Carbon-monoxide dehydrogenase medium subunit n=1 Tax=Nocardioides kongjuensis TaxID=349522 RepID=A0A852RJ33_9ACTN|nr:FAD binding domain-containing protein [Nocardioides kongjuensis]NYD29336.1 carbon-monoxide dehydrogenase medium subunit [Nocardioides kongjuensis]